MRSFLCVCLVVCVWINLSWAQWTQINNGLGSLKITGVARVGTTIYAGTTDKGLFSSTDNGASWSTYSGNDTLPSLVINGLDGIDASGTGMFIYTQNGMALLQPPIPLFIPPFIQTLSNKNITLYKQCQSPSRRRIVGTKSAGVFYTDNDTTWIAATGIPAGASQNITGFISEDINVLALGGTANGAGISTDRGATWTEANTGLTGDALKINSMFMMFALTKNGIYYTSLSTFTGWTPAVAAGDFRICTSDLISGKYYCFGNNVGTSIDVNTSQIVPLSLNGISGGAITSALLYGTNVFVGTETGGVFRSPLSSITSVNEKKELPNHCSLYQNYPNPFNPSTTINYQLSKTGRVRLMILNILGQEVATLMNEEQTAGSHSVVWNASGNASGVYFYRLESGAQTVVKKLVLLR